jgi:CRP/FNR family transcriptional regulator
VDQLGSAALLGGRRNAETTARLSRKSECADCPIRHRAVCARCETDELEKLEAIKYYRSYEAGQTIVWAGDSMDFVASVVRGVASLTQTMEDGRRQMVGLLLPSDFVGRPNRESAPYDVTATTDLQLCCFRRAPFLTMMDETPHIAQRLLEMTLDELDAAREWMLLLGRKTAREKIASFLSIIARRDATFSGHGAMGEVAFDLPLTREAMADYLGPDAGDGQPPDVGAEEGRGDPSGRQTPHRDPRFRPSAGRDGR